MPACDLKNFPTSASSKTIAFRCLRSDAFRRFLGTFFWNRGVNRVNNKVCLANGGFSCQSFDIPVEAFFMEIYKLGLQIIAVVGV